MFEEQNNDSILEHLWQYPNHLSEEMVKCMRDIFLFLADSSKLSSFECMAQPSSPQDHLSYSSLGSFSDSPIINSIARPPSVDMDHSSDSLVSEATFDPYKVPGKLDWVKSIGAYSMAVEVSCLSVGKKELDYAAVALKRFRSTFVLLGMLTCFLFLYLKILLNLNIIEFYHFNNLNHCSLCLRLIMVESWHSFLSHFACCIIQVAAWTFSQSGPILSELQWEAGLLDQLIQRSNHACNFLFYSLFCNYLHNQ